MYWTSEVGVGQGIQTAINCALRLTTCGPIGPMAPIITQMLDGEDKCLIVFWEGDLLGDIEDFDPERGDGRIALLREGMPGFAIPPTFDQQDAAANIRSGVPMWVLHSPDSFYPAFRTLAVGNFHPRWTSATLHFYCPVSSTYTGRMYFGDPRIDMKTREPDWPSLQEQQLLIEEAGGAPEHPPLRAPRHPGFGH